jgi:hypothetical protein
MNKTPYTEEKKVFYFRFSTRKQELLTHPPGDFFGWLETVQLSNLEELAEALDDDDFVRLKMKANGMNYFKRFALKKATTECLTAAPSTTPSMSPAAFSMVNSDDPPSELVCPIRHVLMVNDPVVAPDGYTYERDAIMEWLERGGAGGDIPQTFRLTHEPLGNAILVPNVAIRTMARDWYTKMAKQHAEHS